VGAAEPGEAELRDAASAAGDARPEDAGVGPVGPVAGAHAERRAQAVERGDVLPRERERGLGARVLVQVQVQQEEEHGEAEGTRAAVVVAARKHGVEVVAGEGEAERSGAVGV